MNRIEQTVLIGAVVWAAHVEPASAQRQLTCNTQQTCADVLQEVAPVEIDPSEQPRFAENVSALFGFIGEELVDSIDLAVDDDTGTFEGEVIQTTPQYVSRLEFSTTDLGPVVIYGTPRLPDLDEVLHFVHNQFDYPSRGRPRVNMLVNPGFEQGLSGWARSGGAAIRRDDPAPVEGSAYVYGSATASFTVSQDVALRAWVSLEAIDAGGVTAVFGGLQAGWQTQTDFGVISVIYLNGAGAQLGIRSLAPFYSNHRWVEQAGASAVPPGTRTLRFRFVGTRRAGSNDDAYLDAAYVCLDDGTGGAGARCQPNDAP